MFHRIILFALLLLPFAAPCPAQGQGTEHQGIFAGLLQALSEDNRASLKAFVQSHFTEEVPIDNRMENLGDLVEQGAPFRLLKITKDEGSSLTAEVEDRSGLQLQFTVVFTPVPTKIRGIMVRPLNAKPAKDYSGWTDLGSLVDAIRKDNDIPAMGVAVIEDGHLTVVTRGLKELGKPDEVTADMPWSVGSIGKPICTTVIGKLIEEGKLSWDTKLGDALKDLPMDPGYKDVTLEQIMHHRGGIPQDGGFDQETIERIAGNETDPTKVRENYARDILSRKPIGAPGERFAYSNAGYALLGVVAERATGESYEDLVRNLIFKPLRLQHSYIGESTLPADRPSGHVNRRGKLIPMNFSGPIEMMAAPAGGSLWMSVGDLATFGAEHLKGLQGKDGLLKAETVARLHRGIPEPGGEQAYACGWGVRQNAKLGEIHGHNGSNGTMRAELAILPKSNLVIVSIMNSGGESDPSPALQAVLAIATRFAVK